jgi:hypothetical protein
MVYDISEEDKQVLKIISRTGWHYKYYYMRGFPIQYIFIHTLTSKYAFLFSRVHESLINEPKENIVEYLGCRFFEWNKEWIQKGNYVAMQNYLNYGYSKNPVLFNMTVEVKPNKEITILEFTGDNKCAFFNDDVQEWLFEF